MYTRIQGDVGIPACYERGSNLLRRLLLAFRQCTRLSNDIAVHTFDDRYFRSAGCFRQGMQRLFLAVTQGCGARLTTTYARTRLNRQSRLTFLKVCTHPRLCRLSNSYTVYLGGKRLQLDTTRPCKLTLPDALISRVISVRLGDVYYVAFVRGGAGCSRCLLTRGRPRRLIICRNNFLDPQGGGLFRGLTTTTRGAVRVQF